jgi:hypothetical protein
MSEVLHDSFDDVLEDRLGSDNLVLTVWSEDDFSDSMWEFIHVYGSQADMKTAKILIVSESASDQMRLLSELSDMNLPD